MGLLITTQFENSKDSPLPQPILRQPNAFQSGCQSRGFQIGSPTDSTRAVSKSNLRSLISFPFTIKYLKTKGQVKGIRNFKYLGEFMMPLKYNQLVFTDSFVALVFIKFLY